MPGFADQDEFRNLRHRVNNIDQVKEAQNVEIKNLKGNVDALWEKTESTRKEFQVKYDESRKEWYGLGIKMAAITSGVTIFGNIILAYVIYKITH